MLLWQGENRMMLDSYRDLVKALALSIGSIFLILVAYYRSFGLALIALAAVPLAFIGLFPGHWLFGAQFSASSLIGVVALAGVVVRNSLLIIDFVRDYLKAGLPLEEAAMDAGAVRLRPILLTTLAIIFWLRRHDHGSRFQRSGDFVHLRDRRVDRLHGLLDPDSAHFLLQTMAL